jgi:hypothetical protein
MAPAPRLWSVDSTLAVRTRSLDRHHHRHPTDAGGNGDADHDHDEQLAQAHDATLDQASADSRLRTMPWKQRAENGGRADGHTRLAATEPGDS